MNHVHTAADHASDSTSLPSFPAVVNSPVKFQVSGGINVQAVSKCRHNVKRKVFTGGVNMRVGSRKWLKDKLRKSNKHKQFKINKCKYSSSSVSHLLRSGVSFFFVARHNVRQAPKIYIQACSGRRGHQNTTHNREKKTCGPCHLCGITSDSSRYFHFAEKDNPFYQWVREMKNVTIHDCINFVKNTK